MTSKNNNNRMLIVRGLAFAALVLLAFAYVSPTWWVSLKAPQYPATAFPDGIRIHFHMDGVFNGCELIKSDEKQEDEALNCKHEMDAINHFVGMYPIAAGGPVERVLSPFSFSLLGLMIIVFMLPGRKLRVTVMGLGGIAIGTWMTMALYGEGGIHLLSPNYISDVSSTMDIDLEDYDSWSGVETLKESYNEALGRYFRDMDVINRAVGLMLMATNIAYGVLLAAFVVLTLGLWKTRFMYWMLAVVPAALPVFFIIDYAAWLWWFGHSLNAMGAFTLKPFMPTVLGQGKVAQFYTYSYPHYGYGMLVGISVCLILAALIRRKHLRETGEDS
ncbi:MAG: hypothetical protein ISR45_01990 [Rhodospirillales bacterium]|nr:hypothetical protein [Rhodospirillales bacterium]